MDRTKIEGFRTRFARAGDALAASRADAVPWWAGLRGRPKLRAGLTRRRSSSLLAHGLTVAVGVAAALPVVISTTRAISDGWVPFGDQAVIASRAYDVFTVHTPLVGQYSAASALIGHPTYGLGPMLYWLLALPARFGPPAAVALTMGVVNSAAVMGIVALAHRRGGRAFMFAVAIAAAVMSRSLAPELYHDVWNPSAAILPFALLIFLCWSVACGEYRLLPVTVLVASFVAQCHFAYVPAAAGILAVGAVGLALSRRAEERGSRRRWIAAAGVVGVACWLPPVIDEVIHRPGNLTLTARVVVAHEPTVGWAAGWHAIARAIGALPWWLHAPADPFFPLPEVKATPSLLSSLSAVVIVSALALVVLAGVRRRSPELAAGGAIGLVLCTALATVTAHTPTRPGLMASLGYTLWWGVPAGMFVWLVLGRAAAALLLPASGRPAGRARPRMLLLGAGLSAVLAAGVAASAGQAPDLHRPLYRPIASIAARVDAAVRGTGAVRFAGSSGGVDSVVRAGLRFDLRRHEVLALGPPRRRWGPAYDPDHRRYGYVVYFRDGGRPSAGEGRAIARVSVLDGGRSHTIIVSVAPH